MSSLAKKIQNAKFVVYADFNILNTTPITDLLPLKQVVSFPTRDMNKLDLVFTDIEWYTNSPSAACQKAPPIGRSDHCSIILKSTMRRKPKYVSAQRLIITEKAKVGISNDLIKQSWDHVLSEPDTNIKAKKYHSIVAAIVNEWCPIQTVRSPEDKNLITTPLITKLRRAKKRLYQHGNPRWKQFTNLLRDEIAKFDRQQADINIIRTPPGSRGWWANVKTATGTHRSYTNP